MKRIIEHIESLLVLHDCVIIPDFGGFVLQTIPADYQVDNHFFVPSRKEIVYNPTLTHNDGLLTESYMQHYVFDFEKAQAMIKQDVIQMKERMNESTLRLGAIGIFYKEDGRLVFLPAKTNNEQYSVQSYGLPAFNFLPLSAHQPQIEIPFVIPESGQNKKVEINKTEAVKKNNNRKNIIYFIPVTRTFLRIVATTVAAILLFLFLATPVSDVNVAHYSASFIPQEKMPKKVVDEVVADASHIVSTESAGTTAKTSKTIPNLADASKNVSKDVPNDASNDTSNVASNSTTSTKTTTVRPPKTSSTVINGSPASSGGTGYYVIIGSFNSKARAQTYINTLKGTETANADILVCGKNVRVYARSFSTEKEAQTYMTKLRKNPKHAQVWLYKDN